MDTTDAAGVSQTTTRLPARAVVSLPDLAIVSSDVGGISGRITELFAPSVASVITDDIVSALRSNDVWSGELAVGDADADAITTTSVTLWIPHERAESPPERATVLIGTAVVGAATQVAPDSLTGLPTRVVLLDRLDQARRRSRRNDDLLAALFIDLDGLKSINDRLGHEEGDAALMLAADRIRTCLRDGDTVARFGGDEFVVLCEAIEHEEQAERVAERILEALRHDVASPVSASIGVAFDRGGALNSLELIGRADTAMYRAKALGGSRFDVFDHEMQGRRAAEQSLRDLLLDAIKGDGLDVASQPLFELATGRLAGIELFIRITENDNLVSATDVLRLAREHSEAIDAAMIGRAIALARNWRSELAGQSARIHINLSPQSLASSRFATRVLGALDRHSVDPRVFAFEIDTNDFLPVANAELATLTALRNVGVGLVIDGYGVGSTSLRLIERLQPDMVKVPTLDAESSKPLREPVTVGLLRSVSSLGVSTCVKGIETHEQLDRVVAAGAFAAQGNALAPVAPIEATRTRLDAPARIGF